MGAVYLALDTQLRRAVALKLLPREKAQNPTLVRRFQAEAQSAASLKHENIVTVYEAGEADGYYFIAQEFVEGIDVADLVQRRGVLPAKRSQDIIKQVARALQHASEQGIVHRDIKPANLLIRRDGTVKLADLGLARSMDDSADTRITRAGTTVGTVDYMSPEQARDSSAADVRSDIYSLGCTWYHMLTGSPPYPEGSLTNKLRSHAETPLPDPRVKNANIPEAVVAVLHRMMAKKPLDRYQTAAELIDDLENSNLSRDAVSDTILSDDTEFDATPPAAAAPEPTIARPGKKQRPRETTRDDEDDVRVVRHEPAPTPSRPIKKSPPREVKRDDEYYFDDEREHQKAPAAPEPPAAQSKPARKSPPRQARHEEPPRHEEYEEEEADERGEARVQVIHPEPAASSSRPSPASPLYKGPPPRETKRDVVGADTEEQPEKNYTSLIYGTLALVFVGAVIGLAWLTKGFSSSLDAPDQSANPFRLNEPVVANPANQTPDGKAAVPNAAQANQAQASRDPANNAVSKDGVANADPSNPQQSTGVILPTTTPNQLLPKDVQERRQYLERLGLPLWVGEPRPVLGLAVLAVRAGASGERQYGSLNEALENVPPAGAVISLLGDGPFALRPAQLTLRTRIVIQAGRSAGPAPHPLIVLVPGEKGTETPLQLTSTALELKGVHFALDAAAFKAGFPAALLHVSSGDVYVQDCSFTIKGKSSVPCAAIKLDGEVNSGDSRLHNQTRLLLENSVIRGQDLSVVQAELGHADIVVRDSLAYCGEAPIVHFTSKPRKPADALQYLRFVASTLCTRGNAFQLGRTADDPVTTAVSLLNCVVSAPPDTKHPTLVNLRGWTMAQAGDQMGKVLTWKSTNSLFLGWKTLIETHPEGKTGAVSFQEWAHLWKSKDCGEKEQFQLVNWPVEKISDIAHTDLRVFDPQTIKTQFVKTSSGGWPGCPIESLMVADVDAVEKTVETASRPKIPAGLFDDGRPTPKTIRVDLTKEDLGKAITGQNLPNGTVVIASGFGPRSSSPIVIQKTWIRLHFQQTEGPPLVLAPRLVESARTPPANSSDDAFISVVQGGVEIVNAAFTIPVTEKTVPPAWFMEVIDGDMALRQCRIQGPMSNSRNKGLIKWGRTGQPAPARPFAGELEGYAAITNCFLSGSGVLIEADLRRRALFMRNSIAVSRDDLLTVKLDGVDSQIAGAVDLRRSTFSAPGSIFKVEAAPLTAPTDSPLTFFTDRCVFATPIKYGSKKPTPTLMSYTGPLLETRQLNWWEDRNGYSPDLAYFLRPASESSQLAPQAFEQSWQQQWRPDQIVNPLTGVGGVFLKDDLPHRSKLEAADFQLHARSKAMRWDGSDKPIGAIVGEMNLPEINSVAAPSGKAKATKPGATPIQGF